MTNHHRPSVEEAFNPELRQAQAEWDAYKELRPFEDKNGKVRRTNGKFYSEDVFNEDMDASRDAHYGASMPIAYEGMPITELAGKLAEAEEADDVTIASDVAGVVPGKLKELSITDLAEVLAKAEIDENDFLISSSTDAALEKLDTFYQDHIHTNRSEDGEQAQTNLLDRFITLKERKKTELEKEHDLPEGQEQSTDASASSEVLQEEAEDDSRNQTSTLSEGAHDEPAAESQAEGAKTAEKKPDELKAELRELAKKMGEMEGGLTEEFTEAFQQFHGRYKQLLVQASEAGIEHNDDLLNELLATANIEEEAYDGLVETFIPNDENATEDVQADVSEATDEKDEFFEQADYNLKVIQARLNGVVNEIADFGEADDNQLQLIEQLVDQIAGQSDMDENQREQLLEEQLSKAGVSQERFSDFVVNSAADSANEKDDQTNGRLKATVQRTGEKLKSAAGRSNLLLGKMFYKVGDKLSSKQAELSDNEKLKRGRRIVLATGAVALGGAIYYAQQKGWLDGVTESLPFGAGDTGAEGIAEQVDLGEGLPSEVGPAEQSGVDFTGDIPDEIAEGEAPIDLTGDIPDEIADGEAPDADSSESQTGDDNTGASEGNSSAGTDGGEQVQQIDITNEMRNVRPGQGWYETFQNLNISPSGWSELLDAVGPELELMNLAYPDGSGSYGINSTADLPDDALQLILSKARELGIN